MKETVKNFIKEQYGVSPEYLFSDSPDIAVFRNGRNRKWFGVIMGNIPKRKLGINSEERVDFINLKCDPLLSHSVVDKKGVFPAYHMNKTHWVSVLLDGTVDIEKIKSLIALSYDLIEKK